MSSLKRGGFARKSHPEKRASSLLAMTGRIIYGVPSTLDDVHKKRDIPKTIKEKRDIESLMSSGANIILR
jgi:hypothetical protein